MTIRRFLPAAAILALTVAAAPAFAEAPQSDEARHPGQIARQGVDSLLRAFDQFVNALPQYALPELNAQGDIIIRRKNPRAEALEKEFSDDVVKNI
jgi:hypothetical protein